MPTPLPIEATNTVQLGTDIRLTDLAGDDAVGIGPNGELWLVNIRNGAAGQLTDDGHPKYNAVLSADYVAWIDQRRMLQLPGYPVPIFAGDVFVRHRRTGVERRITNAPASRHGLRISGVRLVWQDNRNGLIEDRRRDHDIYAYDLERDREIPVAVGPGQQLMPAIHGDTVVWTDNRNRREQATSRAGCTNCPDNRFDIYSYNLATEVEKPLAETGDYNGPPSLHGNMVIWQRFQTEGESDIVLLDLGVGTQKVIGAGGRTEASPLISKSHAVWTVREACDVFGLPSSKTPTGVYAYDLDTGAVRQLSNAVEPHALLHGNDALIMEGCHRITSQYAVPLSWPVTR